jgi:NAD(P)-dependent dehydrogenase (short-subunit alcohol dehydrogenase family)
MDLELRDKVALVTGASKGIGRAVALGLAAEGARVVVVARDGGMLDKVAAECRDRSRRDAVAIAADLSTLDEVERVARAATDRLGRIDVLVNNAGIYRAAAVLDVTEEHWDAIMTLNARAVFFASQAVLPTMIAAKRGAIVNLASMAGKVGSRTNLPYNVSKAAVVSMTKSLALAHAADGVRVNCVCPGFVETDMWTQVAREQSALLGLTPEEFTQRRAEQVPLGRMERPEDVAAVIGFLASPRAGYMTGQALSVDGGLVMHG